MTTLGRAVRLILATMLGIFLIFVSREQPRPKSRPGQRPWASAPQRPMRHVRPDVRYLR